MAKNAQNTNPKASPKATAKNVANKALPAMQKNLTLFLATIVALMGILLYANTIHHKYVLDDYPTIKENKLTKKGIHGIPEIFKHSYWYGNDGKDDWLYRPLSVAMFALEWEFWPDQPSAGHTINILLYGLTGFALAARLCPKRYHLEIGRSHHRLIFSFNGKRISHHVPVYFSGRFVLLHAHANKKDSYYHRHSGIGSWAIYVSPRKGAFHPNPWSSRFHS